MALGDGGLEAGRMFGVGCCMDVRFSGGDALQLSLTAVLQRLLAASIAHVAGEDQYQRQVCGRYSSQGALSICI